MADWLIELLIVRHVMPFVAFMRRVFMRGVFLLFSQKLSKIIQKIKILLNIGNIDFSTVDIIIIINIILFDFGGLLGVFWTDKINFL